MCLSNSWLEIGLPLFPTTEKTSLGNLSDEEQLAPYLRHKPHSPGVVKPLG
jgi:hypothetical protein